MSDDSFFFAFTLQSGRRYGLDGMGDVILVNYG